MIWILLARYCANLRSAEKKPRQDEVAEVFKRVCSIIKTRTLNVDVRIDEIGSKKELLSCVAEIREQGNEITEWHAVGWGTTYGPILGSSEWPEEISPYEWSGLRIPFAKQAEARLYMEGSDTWFAPFVATAFNIKTYGCRHLIETGVDDMTAFQPGFWNDAADYNPIAALYAEAFSDITVRWDECRWLERKLLEQKPDTVVDIGCGNGALLAHLSDKITRGIGVDISHEAIAIAARDNKDRKNLSFTVINGPRLPFAEKTADTIVSLLSFRYLDWDPILEELRRIVKPGGHILIVDMLASSPDFYEWPLLLADKLKNLWYLSNRRGYKKALQALVTHPDWRRMIDRHPIRRAEEFTRYLKSRFPGGNIKVLNRGVKAKILAFDSGSILPYGG